MDPLTHAISFDYTSVRELEFDRLPKLLQTLILSDLERAFSPCVVLVLWENAWCRVQLQSGPDEPIKEDHKSVHTECFSLELNGMSLTFGPESVTLILSTESASCPVCHNLLAAPAHQSDWSNHMANHIELRYCADCGDRVTGEPASHEHQTRKAPIRPRPGQLEETPFVCHYCLAFLPTRCALAEHVSSHNVRQRFMCETCGRQFSTQGSRNRHRRQQHRDRTTSSTESRLLCRTCDQSFRKCLRQYILHVNRIHKSQKRLCHLCGKTFSLIGRAMRHVQEAHFGYSSKEVSPQGSSAELPAPAPATTLLVLPGQVARPSTLLVTPVGPANDSELDLSAPPLLCCPGDCGLAAAVSSAPPNSGLDESSNCSFSSALLASPSKYFTPLRGSSCDPSTRQPP